MKKMTVLCMVLVLIFAGCAEKSSAIVTRMAARAQQAVDEAYGDDASIKVTVSARGETIIYTYQASNEVTSSAEEIADGLENGKRYYDDLITQMLKDGVKNPAVVVEYLDRDGGMIYTREFK